MVAKLGRPVLTVVEVRLYSPMHVAGRSVPRATAPFRRVRLPAKPGLVLGRVGRVESAKQREIPSAALCARPVSDRADGCQVVHASPGLRTSRASARKDREVQCSLSWELALSSMNEESFARHCARANAFDLVRPPAPTSLVLASAGRVSARYGRGLLLPSASGDLKCQACAGVGSCARRMW